VRVQVPVGKPQLAVALPASALRKGPEGDHVFVLVADEKGNTRAQARPVRVDAMTGNEVVIGEGVKVGERVAASGSFKLRDAALVSAQEPAQTVAFNNR
jgi:membrane fusion protein (multidrug efflux system)